MLQRLPPINIHLYVIICTITASYKWNQIIFIKEFKYIIWPHLHYRCHRIWQHLAEYPRRHMQSIPATRCRASLPPHAEHPCSHMQSIPAAHVSYMWWARPGMCVALMQVTLPDFLHSFAPSVASPSDRRMWWSWRSLGEELQWHIFWTT